jgi:hypothetical protein
VFQAVLAVYLLARGADQDVWNMGSAALGWQRYEMSDIEHVLRMERAIAVLFEVFGQPSED